MSARNCKESNTFIFSPPSMLNLYVLNSPISAIMMATDESQVEAMILGKAQDLPKGLERENRIIQTIMRQILFALDGLHTTGIVHRDIKPQNIIFSEGNCKNIMINSV